VECKDDADWAKHRMMMDVDRTRQRGQPREIWWDDFMEDTNWYEKFWACLKDAEGSQQMEIWSSSVKWPLLQWCGVFQF